MAEKEMPKIDSAIEEAQDAVLSIPRYPSNRKETKTKEEPKPRPEIKRVVSSKVQIRKKGVSSKIREKLLGDEGRTIGDYILHDIAGVAVKNFICDIFGWNGIVEMIVWGGRKNSRNIRGRDGKTHVNYGGYSTGGYGARPVGTRTTGPREYSHAARSRHDFEEIIIGSRGEAEEILSMLVDLVEDYGEATVADLYTMVDIQSTHADHKYGWTDLRNSSTSRIRNGYVINLPKPIVLD